MLRDPLCGIRAGPQGRKPALIAYYGAAQTAVALTSTGIEVVLLTITNHDVPALLFPEAATSVMLLKKPPPMTFVPAGQKADAPRICPAGTETVGPVRFVQRGTICCQARRPLRRVATPFAPVLVPGSSRKAAWTGSITSAS